MNKEKIKIAKVLYPELDEYWIEWLFRPEHHDHPKRQIVDKVYVLLGEKKHE